MALTDFGNRLLGAIKDAGQFVERGAQNFTQHFQQNVAQPIEQHVVHPFVQYIGDQGKYIQQNGLQNAANQVAPIANSFAGRYVQNQVVDPITQSIANYQVNPSLDTAAGIVTHGARGLFDATPLGVASNAAIAGVSSTAEALRTGQADPGQNFANAQQLSTGLGITNPYAAILIDFLAGTATLNPEGGAAAIGRIGNISRDASTAENISNVFGAGKNLFLGTDRQPGGLRNNLSSEENIRSNPLLTEAEKAQQLTEPGFKPSKSPEQTAFASATERPTNLIDTTDQTQLVNSTRYAAAEGSKLKRATNPVSLLPDTDASAFQNYVNSTKHDTLTAEALRVQGQFSDLPEIAKRIEGVDTPSSGQISRFQANTPATPEEAQGFVRLRQFFDQKYNQLQKAGVDVGYLENYLNQVWKGSKAEINDIADKFISLHPGFTKERIIADYQTGIQAGLVPKTTNISELAGLYEKQTNRAIADSTYFNELKSRGLIQPTPQQGWTEVSNLPSNRAYFERDGRIVDYNGPLYAPDALAKVLNNHFQAPNEILQSAASVASGVKNTVLSGGIPGTAWNMHGITTTGRDILTSANPVDAVKTAIVDIANMSYNGLNKKFVADNLDRIIALQHEGMTLGTESPRFWSEDQLKPTSGLGKAKDAVFNAFEKPLFEGFLPATKSRAAIEMVDSMIKAGTPEKEALNYAAHWANSIFGGNNLAELGTDKNFMNVMRTFFLAPDTYISLAKTGRGVAQAIFTPGSKEYSAYRSVAYNTAGAYMLMNLANKATSGHYLWQNDPGHTFEVQIGFDENGRPRYLRPLGQGLDFVKLPIDALSAVTSGDLTQLSRIAQNRLNPIIAQAVQVMSNTNPFGQKIVNKDDSAVTKLGKYGANAVAGFVPQAAASAIRLAAGQSTPEETVANALELPVRYGRGASTKADVAYINGLKQQGMSGAEINANLKNSQQGQAAITALNKGNSDAHQALLDRLKAGDTSALDGLTRTQQNSLIDAVVKENQTSSLSPLQKQIFNLSNADKVKLLQTNPNLSNDINAAIQATTSGQSAYSSVPQGQVAGAGIVGTAQAASPTSATGLLAQIQQYQSLAGNTAAQKLYAASNPALAAYLNGSATARADFASQNGIQQVPTSSGGITSLARPLGTGKSKVGSGLKKSSSSHKGRSFKPKGVSAHIKAPTASGLRMRSKSGSGGRVKVAKLKHVSAPKTVQLRITRRERQQHGGRT